MALGHIIPPLKILFGFPQGSILDHLLFILYINDITNTSTHLDFILFSDDRTILFSSDDICRETHQINKDLFETSNRFRANNVSKTNYMIMGILNVYFDE